MEPNDYEKLMRVAFPMEPSKMLLSQCNFDERICNCIYHAQIEYYRDCAKAEHAMYEKILECIKPKNQ